MSSIFRALIMGPPGSGKGTISRRIVRDFKFFYVSSGDALRDQMSKNTDNGKVAKEFINKGELVPDSLVTSLILDMLKQHANENWLLDGYPRTVKQAADLAANFKISLAVNLIVPDEVIISRLKNRWLHPSSGRIYNIDFNPPKVAGKDDITGEDLIQREDDKPHVVLARLKNYHNQISPVIAYYRNQNVLKEFKGTETDSIWPQVKDCLHKELKKANIT